MFLINNFGQKLVSVARQINDKIQNEYNEVVKENIQMCKEHQEEEKKQSLAIYPWVQLKAYECRIQGSYQDIIREEIELLSQNEELFIIQNYEYDFNFKFHDYVGQAILMLKYDNRLAHLRNKLVPIRVSEENFWKNYFYQIELIKINYKMFNKLQHPEQFINTDVSLFIQDENNYDDLEQLKEFQIELTTKNYEQK